jgi:3-oxoacyl-[acyl-carrier-protein] synthase-3
MSGAYLDHLSYALGDEEHTLEAAGAAQRLVSGPDALRAAGFRKHFVAGSDTSAYDLALAAVRPIAGALGGVDAIVYASCLPCNANLGSGEAFSRTRDVKHLMDFPASRLQAELGLENAAVIGIDQQACTGALGSLRIARALLAAEPETHAVLCVTADRFPAGALYEQAYNLVSDGAAACVVSRQPRGYRLLATHAITNGALSLASDDQTTGMFFGYVHRLVQETLERAGVPATQLDWIVPQNTHSGAWGVLARLLQIDPARVASGTIAEVGHVISGDCFINLHRLASEGRVHPGQKLMLVMAGYGLNWQATLLERAAEEIGS